MTGRKLRLPAPFQLRIGQIAVLEDKLTIAHPAGSGDSRCPGDVQCVLSGDATAHLDITSARMAWTERDFPRIRIPEQRSRIDADADTPGR